MNKGFTALVKFLLVATVAVLVYAVAQFWWRNHNTIRMCRAKVTEALNRQLRLLKLEEVPPVDFPDASRILGVPESLQFDRTVFHSTAELPHRCVGSMRGTYNRTTGLLEVEFDFNVADFKDTRLTLRVDGGP
ncbi:MAG: hypothetical protein ACUVUC_08850 [Thermoguttaceae bacterium]